MDVATFSARLEPTILAPEAASRDVHRVVTEAMRGGCPTVVVAPVWVARVATMLRGSGVRVCAVVSFPHGSAKATLKAIEATSCLKDGADEIEVVPHLPALLAGDSAAVRGELLEIARAARATRRDAGLRAVVETAVLLRLAPESAASAFAAACSAVRESAFDMIVAATGYHPAGGATVEAIRLLTPHAEGLTIKAAGVTDRVTAEAILAAGASRVGSEVAQTLLGGR